jgi:sugar phosphate isomerase/epimerase
MKAAHIRPALAVREGTIADTVEHARELTQLLNVPTAGVAIDTAALVMQDCEPAEAIAMLGAQLAHVTLHDTDGVRPSLPPGQGSLDFPAILRALDAAGYSGPLVVALDDIHLSPEERAHELAQGIAYLQPLLQRKAA